ncbi:MAG: type II toxin-antitoxin system VapC family toxin [Betaproteobacteria bacterium]|nr:type II toxin-antitoxin system VapC family toxin [Betaproteobacteria bacterium]
MIALDTNILARYLLNDEPKQCRAAAALLRKREAYTAPPTVLLELVWVLGVNDCSRTEIVGALKHLVGLPNFKPREFEAVCRAIQWYEEGMDFGDALHLALSAKDEQLLTFDRSLARLAERIGAAPAVNEVQ